MKPIVLCMILLGVGLTGCSSVPVKTDEKYQALERTHIYLWNKWAFNGRISVSNGKESWSANIVWEHTEGQDEIKLSGFLGQGAAVITLTDTMVTINRGDEKPRQSEHVEAFIQKELGIVVPVRALRFWVLGLINPSETYTENGDGFQQSNWDVHYLQMQNVGSEWLPRKMAVEQGDAKLKLMVDQWILS
jgi:outer membrane lipoprotein LolB